MFTVMIGGLSSCPRTYLTRSSPVNYAPRPSFEDGGDNHYKYFPEIERLEKLLILARQRFNTILVKRSKFEGLYFVRKRSMLFRHGVHGSSCPDRSRQVSASVRGCLTLMLRRMPSLGRLILDSLNPAFLKFCVCCKRPYLLNLSSRFQVQTNRFSFSPASRRAKRCNPWETPTT